jgi:ABC-2 type transport system ATP-binding protein
MATSISLQGLTRRFGDVTAVDALSLMVNQGEILGFLGPNGAGKTTTMRMMTGALKPTSGKVLVGENEVRPDATEIKQRIGVCPQEVVLWERLTAAENLALVGCMYGMRRRSVRQRSDELLDALGLAEKRNVRASRLSGGMKRRLNLAMALIHDPEIIVLDEPITGLDPQSRLLASDFIRSLCREHGKTVILSTHLMEVASSLSDQVAIIDHGKLLVLDRLEALRQNLGRGDVVELGLTDQGKTEATLELIRRLDGVEQVTEQTGRIRFQAPGAVSMLPEIFRRLSELGAEIEKLSVRPNTLEDIFLSLTGRGLRD